MSTDIRIAPSILSANLLALNADLERVKDADYIHFDVMDGHFTPNLTYGPGLLRAIKQSSALAVDVHLMVDNPDTTAAWYAEAGADIITLHWEASVHLHRTLHHLRSLGTKAGVALNPATPVSLLASIIEDVDIVLLMSVNPGFGGQSFIPHTLQKLKTLRVLCKTHGVSPLIEVDGGISAANAAEVVSAGANILVAGSAIFGAADPATELAHIRTCAAKGLTLSQK